MLMKESSFIRLTISLMQVQCRAAILLSVNASVQINIKNSNLVDLDRSYCFCTCIYACMKTTQLSIKAIYQLNGSCSRAVHSVVAEGHHQSSWQVLQCGTMLLKLITAVLAIETSYCRWIYIISKTSFKKETQH